MKTTITALLFLLLYSPPLVWADTFGCETIGVFTADIEDTIIGGKFQCPANGTADSIAVYLHIGGEASRIICVAIYEFESGSDTILVDSGSLPASEWTGWAKFPLQGNSLTADTWYLLAAWAFDAVGVCEAYYSTTIPASDIQASKAQIMNGWPDPLNGLTITTNRKVSIYCYYTVVEAAAVGQLMIIQQ